MSESLVGLRCVKQPRHRDNLVAHALISERMCVTSYEPSLFAQEAAEAMGCLEGVIRKVERGCASSNEEAGPYIKASGNRGVNSGNIQLGIWSPGEANPLPTSQNNMPAPAHYCYINTTIPIVADILPDAALKKVHQVQCHLEYPLEENNVQHVVNAHMWTAEPPVASEVVNWWGSFAHPGDLSKDAEIFVTSVEQFPWANMDGKPPMVITQGKVESVPSNECFIIAGAVWGRSLCSLIEFVGGPKVMCGLAGSTYDLPHEREQLSPLSGVRIRSLGRSSIYNAFKLKVNFPETPRWNNVPRPTVGAIVALRGPMVRREASGIYVINLVEYAMPTAGKGDNSPKTPEKRSATTTPVRRSRKRNNIKEAECPEDSTNYSATWANPQAPDYVSMLPLGRLPTVQVLGMAEKDEEKNLFVIRGTVWGGGANQVFRFRVWIPSIARWRNVPKPKSRQHILVCGQLARRDPDGLYVIYIQHMTLPWWHPQDKPTAPPTPATPMHMPTTSINTVTPVDDPEDQGPSFDERDSTAEGSGSSNKRKRSDNPGTPSPPSQQPVFDSNAMVDGNPSTQQVLFTPSSGFPFCRRRQPLVLRLATNLRATLTCHFRRVPGSDVPRKGSHRPERRRRGLRCTTPTHYVWSGGARE